MNIRFSLRDCFFGGIFGVFLGFGQHARVRGGGGGRRGPEGHVPRFTVHACVDGMPFVRLIQ